MIRLCYSNRLEELVALLGDALPPPGRVTSIFDGPWLVIPGRPLDLFVDLELCRRRGISGNVDTMSIHGLFSRLCAEALPDVTLIERGHVVGELLAVLSEPEIEPGPIRDHLLGAGRAPAAIDRRRVDIAQALGALFDDWTLTRPELIAAWRDGKVATTTPTPTLTTDGSLQRAEHALGIALYGAGGRFERRGAAEGRRYLTLEAFLAEKLDAAWRPPEAVHVFGVSRISRGLQIALGRLGTRTALHLYAVNPCRQFWEDVETRSRRAPVSTVAATAAQTRSARRGPGRGSVDPRQLDLLQVQPGDGAGAGPRAGSNPAAVASDADTDMESDVESDVESPWLRLWGHAARDNTRLLSALTDGDSEEHFVDPGPADGGDHRPTLLDRLHRDILDREKPRRGQSRLDLTGAGDESLRVIGAPNPRRELETIAADIWALVRADADATSHRAAPRRQGPLLFSDVAVLVAGPDEPYLSLARAVFREANELPHSIVTEPLAASSHLTGALMALLALPAGQLTRREVLDVIAHPNVRARFPEADPAIWLDLCDSLSIVRGSDRAALSDTYIDRDAFNWDQGCKRLALGLFARGPRSGAYEPIALPAGGAYLPAEVSTDVRPDADALVLLVRSLLADVRFAQTAQMSLADWMRFARAVLRAYVVPIGPEDEAARLRIFAEMDRLARQAPGTLTVGFAVASDLLREALADLRGARGQMLGAGVVVGTLAALRSIPFRVLYVPGLGADRFPAADRRSPLEIETEQRRAGEITARDRDRDLFLQALLAARQRLVLSYVDRDAVTGEPRDPSPVITELLDELRQGTLRPQATPSTYASAAAADTSAAAAVETDLSIVARVPLHRDEDPRVTAAFAAADAEARARLLGQDLRARIPAVDRLNPRTIIDGLSPASGKALAPLLGTATLDDVPDPAPGIRPSDRRVLRLSDLRRFLECPLQGSARLLLRLRDLPDDTEARETEDEPLSTPRRLERMLLGEVFTAAWAGAPSPDGSVLANVYDAVIARSELVRDLPAGAFRLRLRRRHLAILEQWVQALAAGDRPANRHACGPARRVCFGRPSPFAPPAELRPPLVLTIDAQTMDFGADRRSIQIEIHGVTEPQLCFGDESGSVVLATSSDTNANERDSLRAYFDYLALAASTPGPTLETPADAVPLVGFSGAVCRPARDGGASSFFPVAFRPLDAPTARRALTGLVTELLARVHGYLFPCEAVFRSWDGEMTLYDRINQIRSDDFYRDRCSSGWGPVPDPFDYPTPAADVVDRIAADRFGLFQAQRIAPSGKIKRQRP